MYNYSAQSPEAAAETVKANAGRVQGGDFKWTFNNSVDDESYTVNKALKSALISYKDSIVAIGSGFSDSTVTQPDDSSSKPDDSSSSKPDDSSSQAPVSSGSYVHNFTKDGTSDSFFSITGNLSTSKGTVNYNGMTLTQCLKMESATNISFHAPSAGKLTLVFVESTGNIKLDGNKLTASNGVITADVSAGSHTLTKADVASLFYMAYTSSNDTSSKTDDSSKPDDSSSQGSDPVTADLYPSVKTQVKDHKIGFKWTAVPGAEKYGIGVFQANKWVVKKQVDGSITTWTSPQVANGTYRLVVLAKVNGEWVSADVFKRSFYVTVS